VETGGSHTAARPPALQHGIQVLPHGGEIRELAVQLGAFAHDEIADVGAGTTSGALDDHELPDLAERETEPARPRHESQQGKRVCVADSVWACVRRGRGKIPAASYRRNAFRLTPVRLAVADEQPASRHARSVHLAPGGKVKGILDPWSGSGLSARGCSARRPRG
jgi:hypothetical protein